jgi:hypothetical protein
LKTLNPFLFLKREENKNPLFFLVSFNSNYIGNLSETPVEWMDENEDEIWMNNQDPCELWMYVVFVVFSFPLRAYVMLWK